MSFPVPITLPRSKSIVIRCLIINYLKDGTLLPVFEEDPNDIKVVYNALETIDKQKKRKAAEETVIDVQDCGTAYRFLMALLAVTPGKWLLTGTSRLLERPILPLVHFLNAKGACIEKMKIGWRIKGLAFMDSSSESELHPSMAEPQPNWGTSQYISAIMMVFGIRYAVSAAPKSPSNFEGVPEERGSLYENPYIQMTATILNADDHSGFLHFTDWSAAVFWLAKALLVPNAHYFLKDLHFDGLQGDAEIVSWFEKCGLGIIENNNGIEVIHNSCVDISEQEVDVTHIPDLAMNLAVLSVCYPFQLTLSGVKNLNLKESNRLDIIEKELSKFTKIEKHSEDSITIHKRTGELPKVFHFDSYNDHRFVMAWSLFKNFGKVIIENSECIKKSYPTFDFFETNCNTPSNLLTS